MIIRQNIPRDPKNPEDHLSSGFEGNNIPTDFTIPSLGLVDVDQSVKKLFDQELGFQVRVIGTKTGTVNVKKPVVSFAVGERFAISKKISPDRDENAALILPAISIRRTNVEQTSQDTTSRGMNQTTGDIVIRRRLDSSDRNYQNLINKLALKNLGYGTQPESSREKGEFGPSSYAGTAEGGRLEPHLTGKNIYETITIPQPQFWTQTYEIIFWTNYTEHMNYLIETLFSSFLPQDKMVKLTTDKGYWFIGYIDDIMTSNDNFEDFDEQERIIKYSFTMKVKSFLLVPDGPGNAVGIRRYVSSPTITFDTYEVGGRVVDTDSKDKTLENKNDSKFVLSDFEQDSTTVQEKTSLDKVSIERETFNLKTGKMEKKKVSIEQRNQKNGETSYYTSNITSLEELANIIK